MDLLLQKYNFIELTMPSPLDTDKLLKDVKAAELAHSFMKKSCLGWDSIPLRSVNGVEGITGNLGGGVNNSANVNDYKYTRVMDSCPYIKEIIESFGGSLLKVRIMRLVKGKKIGTHKDAFEDDNIIRFHIPIVTDPGVRFIVEDDDQHLQKGLMYWVNVRKSHHVNNKSQIDRIHLVFDMYRNEKIENLFTKSDNIYIS
jgi:hypothetical protein